MSNVFYATMKLTFVQYDPAVADKFQQALHFQREQRGSDPFGSILRAGGEKNCPYMGVRPVAFVQ